MSFLVGLWNCVVSCVLSVAEATSVVTHGTAHMAGSCLLALGGLLESLKMVGYLSMHVLLRGREYLCRGLLFVLECCGIAASLALYFANTVVNYVLIGTQNAYSALLSVWHTVSSPIQKVVELTLTLVTFLYSSLVGTSTFLWTPCKLALDFLVSLAQIFVSIFITNVYGFLLTVAIAAATTVYLNPELARQVQRRAARHADSSPALRRLFSDARALTRGLRRERMLWRQLSRQGSWLSLALRMRARRNDDDDDSVNRNDNRVGGDGDPGDERRDPPDGRAGDAPYREPPPPPPDQAYPSSSTDRPLKQLRAAGKEEGLPPADSLLSLLKEQEERKKCVICQDCSKTVVLLPCRHLCLCRGCTDILLRQALYRQNCPLCRHMILNTMDVYL
ncbi:E3 ubiquitin-protein ligase RNF26 [Merluccius polli]|uniref:E3 ubiquitin-protein ligase RNF26 n=1 Tax=Merluccius polli TaxID=89951 RepID=A0AA47N0D2_MERPO|nr:E3 ubiquitin-protein ligase RNF26 [Merluccius polli]